MTTVDWEQAKMREAARLLALVEAERRYYQEVLASVPAAIAVIASDLTFVAVSRRFRSDFDVRVEDLSKLTLHTVAPEEAVQRQISEAILAGKPPMDIQTRIHSSRGDRMAKLSVQVLPGWSEETGREAVLLIEPLPAVEQTQHQARSSAMDEAPGVHWERDPKSLEFRYVSAGAEALLGFPAEQWLAKDFHLRRIHPADRAWVEQYVSRSASRLASGDCEFRAVKADGTTVWLRDVFRVLLDPSGEAGKIVGFTIDVSEQTLRNTLAVQAERIAAIGRLTNKITHETNNLLTILAGYGDEFAAKLPADHPARKDAEELLATARRLGGVTTELMPLIRPPSTHPETIEVNPFLLNLREKLGAVVGPATPLEYELSGEALVNVDPEALAGAILEIAGQMRQVMPDGGRIRIATSSTEFYAVSEGLAEGPAPGRYICLTLSDNGPEMDDETRNRLFEPGFVSRRAARSLTGVYQSIKSMGGDLLVSRGPRGGAAFNIYLPMVEIGAGTMAGVPSSEGTPLPDPAPKPRTILIVEDEAGIKALLRKILQKQGYVVLEASGGEEALRIAEEHKGPIHLLLADVVMPRINGYELAYRLRTARPYMRVLFVSGYTMEDLAAYGTPPSASAFLQKPFSLATLVEKAKSILAEGATSFQAWTI